MPPSSRIFPSTIIAGLGPAIHHSREKMDHGVPARASRCAPDLGCHMVDLTRKRRILKPRQGQAVPARALVVTRGLPEPSVLCACGF